jgi:hypothetical protein
MENLLLVAINSTKTEILTKYIDSLDDAAKFLENIKEAKLKLFNDGCYIFDFENQILNYMHVLTSEDIYEVNMADFEQFEVFNSKQNHFVALLVWAYYRFKLNTSMEWVDYNKSMITIEQSIVDEIIAKNISNKLFKIGPETDNSCYFDTISPSEYVIEEFLGSQNFLGFQNDKETNKYKKDKHNFVDFIDEFYDEILLARFSAKNPSVNTKTFFNPAINLTEI